MDDMHVVLVYDDNIEENQTRQGHMDKIHSYLCISHWYRQQPGNYRQMRLISERTVSSIENCQIRPMIISLKKPGITEEK